MQLSTLIAAMAGLVFGFLGAALGVINTCHAISRDRVSVRVIPIWLLGLHGREVEMGIRMINLSYMPVTINHVGFTLRRKDAHMPILEGFLEGGSLPKRMEPRTQLTALVGLATFQDPDFAGVQRAYVDTACGRRFTGTSKALRSHVHELCTARKEKPPKTP